MDSQQRTAELCAPDPEAEPCPTPLAWHQVVAEFEEVSQSFRARCCGTDIHGRMIGAGPPLYFINGLLGDLRLFSLLAWLLRDEFRCVLYDLPDPFQPRDPANFGRLLLELADHNDDATFTVYSAGFGCVSALTAMSAAPARIRAAVLQGGFARCRLSVTERFLASVGSYCGFPIGAVPGVSRILEENHRSWFPPFDESRWTFASEQLEATATRALARRASVLKRFDMTSVLPELTSPTLLVRCDGDSRLQASAQDQLEAGLPNVQAERLPVASGLAFLTHPHRIRKLLRPFAQPDPGA